MARVLMVASEAAPFVKTGGLADVLGSLPGALRAAGHDVAVLLPKYRAVEPGACQRIYHDLPVWLGSTHFGMAVDQVIYKDVPYYFLDCPALYDREGIYNIEGKDYLDNDVRFAALSRAALEVIRRIFRPQVVHCHDWQAALVAPYMRELFHSDPTFIGLKVLFTIHNLGYQGIFGPQSLPLIGLGSSMLKPAAMEYWGNINFLKAGIVFSDAISTVSPTYALEIQTPEFGFGLDGLLRSRAGVLTGILNGVDYGEWNPQTDKLIPCNYGPDAMDGKAACKRRLLDEMGLPPDAAERPLIGIVSRFAIQKGFDLIADIAGQLLSEDISMAVLGSGEPAYEQMFRDLQAARPDRLAVRVGYDNALAHLIEAGSDMFLMPSRYEPCGLNQMYSLKYGTPPIVRATGGLNDTIDDSVGFKFQGYSGQELLDAVRAGLAAFADRQEWGEMVRRGMEKDFSWAYSARCYSELYNRLIAGRAARAA